MLAITKICSNKIAIFNCLFDLSEFFFYLIAFSTFVMRFVIFIIDYYCRSRMQKKNLIVDLLYCSIYRRSDFIKKILQQLQARASLSRFYVLAFIFTENWLTIKI